MLPRTLNHHTISNRQRSIENNGVEDVRCDTQASKLGAVQAEEPVVEVLAPEPIHAPPVAGGGAKKRMNKQDRLREKAAAEAAARKGRTLRCVLTLLASSAAV